VTNHISKQHFDINRFDASFAQIYFSQRQLYVGHVDVAAQREKNSQKLMPDFCESARKRPAVFERRGVNGTSCGKSRKNVLAFKAVFRARLSPTSDLNNKVTVEDVLSRERAFFRRVYRKNAFSSRRSFRDFHRHRPRSFALILDTQANPSKCRSRRYSVRPSTSREDHQQNRDALNLQRTCC